MSSTLRHLSLDNGLQVTLRHAPQLKRCAAAVRVMAGSHDAPRRYAGMAHFLEHLLFLGNQRFPLDDGLMRYVQRHGGQVNASTRERTTDYFFEVPQAALAGALERLCEMLARPSFDIPRQLREREVIHAEFIAWSRNAQAQAQFALLQQVSLRHPLSAFQAGNRFSLPVHSHEFQTALQHFHQRWYQGGQMHLSLSGPHRLDELQALVQQAGSVIASGARIVQATPPALVDRPLAPTLNGRHLDLLLAVERQSAGLDQAIEFLATWLADTRAGGLQAALRQRGWLQAFECSPLYSFAGQALLHLRARLGDAGNADQVQALLFDWLRFFREADWSPLKQEYTRLQQRREQTATALDLARRDSSAQPYLALSGQAEATLRVLLDQMLENSPPVYKEPWRLPAAEPLLDVPRSELTFTPAPAGLVVSPLLPAQRQHGVVYLRWQLASALRGQLWQVLDQALQPLRERAASAAIELQFDATGPFWQLRCSGVPQAVVMVVMEALETLRHPSPANWMAKAASEPEPMPIRALLGQLPEQLVGQDKAPSPSGSLNQSDVDALWAHARWQGMATGFDDPAQQALNRALQAVPGHPQAQQPVVIEPVRRWQTLLPPASEHAVLLFCPLADEACARLLAQQIQGPFYQRLRVELQLGYAVFSAFRQVQGCSGLLFGVQSPSASHAQILDYVREFFAALPQTLGCSADSREALAAQLDEAAMSNAEVAEWAWQTQLAGRSQASLEALRSAVLAVDQARLHQCAEDLLQARHGWLCLANGPAPGDDWHARR
ncbi:pyrroloquinoline quinone biosynthesis protein PqqF [Pseudomonas sp. BJa5]|uniref:pyrroloquinoline quinone biosynthesis protein PqqF n=1 Tax=Pseudomonas sp. BJa5 TaxID=2936270 RepID=UPI002559B43F|nr:pyrroloquinoline quinone biosynthesis protein PqqF [Pseudomonas sp. BGr12]MDL2421559.1 pyrroloquinoline quinone biosynthesis protein PqqF [Pseudomonas sp. BGr12]